MFFIYLLSSSSSSSSCILRSCILLFFPSSSSSRVNPASAQSGGYYGGGGDDGDDDVDRGGHHGVDDDDVVRGDDGDGLQLAHEPFLPLLPLLFRSTRLPAVCASGTRNWPSTHWCPLHTPERSGGRGHGLVIQLLRLPATTKTNLLLPDGHASLEGRHRKLGGLHGLLSMLGRCRHLKRARSCQHRRKKRTGLRACLGSPFPSPHDIASLSSFFLVCAPL